jgi:hypothetical protein
MKRTTADVNRKNFENARRILFGTDIIPGTNREHWTTAGVFDPIKMKADEPFQLGPYTYQVYARRQFSTTLLVGKLGHIYIYDKFIILDFDAISIENNHAIEGNVHNTHYQRQKKWFRKNNTLHFSITFTQGVNSSYGGLTVPQIGNITPTDLIALKELFRQSKHSTIEPDNLLLKWDTGKVICDIPPREGVIHIDDSTALVVAIGFPGIIVHVTTVAPMPGPYCMCFNEKRKDSTFVALDTLRTYLDAVRWIMHVLTGPDPRFGTKESSEPKPLETWFKMVPDGDNFYTFNKQKYTFFITDINRAFATRDAVLYYLHHIPNSVFVSNYTVYIKNPGSTISKGAPYPPQDFLHALQRIKEYTEHEFLGCAICTMETNFKCGGECQNLYCSAECQQLDHLENECPTQILP